MGNKTNIKITNNIKLVDRGKETKEKVERSTLDKEFFDINHYQIPESENFKWDEETIKEYFGEDKLEDISPYLFDLEENEAGILLDLINGTNPRYNKDWLSDLKKMNYHVSDAPNNPFNKQYSWTLERLIKQGILEEFRTDGYGNTHYKPSKTGKIILQIAEKLGKTQMFPLEEDTKKEDFYYNTKNTWENLWTSYLKDITKERFRFSLPDGGFATYQSKSEGNVYDLTKHSGGRQQRDIPKTPEPFTYRIWESAMDTWRGSTNPKDDLRREEPLEFDEFYEKYTKDFGGYEFFETNKQKTPKVYKPEGHSEPLLDELQMGKNYNYTQKAMAKHIEEILNQDTKNDEVYPVAGKWYSDSYAWRDDETRIIFQSKDKKTGEIKDISVPFYKFAKFYDNKDKYRYVDMKKEIVEDDGDVIEDHTMAIFDGEKMVGLLPLGKYVSGLTVTDVIAGFYADMYPKLKPMIASLHSPKHEDKTYKLKQ